MNALLVYSNKITNRTRFIFRLFFRELMGLELQITNDAEEFIAHPGPKLSYGQHALKDELFFYARNLLFESGIIEQNISVFDWENKKVFFATGKTSALPFDPFAAGFYLVSRYEEYLPHIRDSLDRFDAHNGIAWQHKFLRIPVVNQWAELVKQKLAEKFPQLKFSQRTFRFTPTIDIDNAYAYRMKGVMRTIGGYGKALLNFNWEDAQMRSNVIFGNRRDPYDTYDYQLEMIKRNKFQPIYFFLVGDYGVNDKNISTQNRRFRELISRISDYADVGVHPSFGSNNDASRLPVEIARLKSILHRDITKSRQHFLMLKFPNTYRNLIERDITDDYSMGFANEIGFRAGICTSFNFYDLDLESETALRIHPFAVMDATLNLYMKLEPAAAIEETKKIISEIKKVNGDFILIWHNETLSDEKQWKGWRNVFEEIIDEALK